MCSWDWLLRQSLVGGGGGGVGGGGSGCGFSQRQEYLAIWGLLNGILYTKRILLCSVSNVDVVLYFYVIRRILLKSAYCFVHLNVRC